MKLNDSLVNKLASAVEIYSNYGTKRFLKIVRQHIAKFSLDQRPLIGILGTPILGLLQGEMIIKKLDGSYMNLKILGKQPTGGRIFYSPKFSYAQKKARVRRYRRRYFCHPDVPLCSDDVCLDIGAYIGISTGVAAEICDRVIALEPSPRNFNFLRKNIRHNNVSIHNVGIWKETNKINFQLGSDTTDDGFLTPDSGFDYSMSVRAFRLDHFLQTISDVDQRYDIEDSNTSTQIDFLKVEAEGAEPEVLRGLHHLDIPKIVVLCTAEREGIKPTSEVSKILRELNYDIIDENYKDTQSLFARKSKKSE